MMAHDPSGPHRDREAFLDILSHELRTPVTTIYGGAQLLATRELPPARRRAVAADVGVEADRLYRLVEDLMALARSENGDIHSVGEPVAVGRLVAMSIERELARHPGARISFLGTEDAAADRADEELLNHVVRNLLDNAIRYGAAAGPIEVIVDASTDEVIVRVVDRGEPPPPGSRSFDLTTRSRGTAAGRAGAGIGLYVANKLVEAMNGRMWVRPARPTGVEFGFALARRGSAPV
jgi:K+-sensing histidine kinase KdpD